MCNICDICKHFVNIDYLIRDANKAIKIRCKISKNAGGGTYLKIINKIREKKYNKICYKNNAFLPIQINFKKEGKVCFPHGLCGIFISSGAKIGENCTIFQEVTIGSNTLKDSKNVGAPTIGDNVYIGAGAKIIGNVKVGDNVRIGANAIVVNDVPDNATVIVDNVRVILHDTSRNNRFVPYIKNQKKHNENI